jgi:hypothetical protein
MARVKGVPFGQAGHTAQVVFHSSGPIQPPGVTVPDGQGCWFSLVRRHRMRTGADNPVTGLWLSWSLRDQRW